MTVTVLDHAPVPGDAGPVTAEEHGCPDPELPERAHMGLPVRVMPVQDTTELRCQTSATLQGSADRNGAFGCDVGESGSVGCSLGAPQDSSAGAPNFPIWASGAGLDA